MKIEESLPFGFEDTSYQAAGGAEGVEALVTSFYHYMDTLPEAKRLRAMHSEDLTESIDKLTRFLSGWLGGPNTYREKYGSINIPKAHAHLDVTMEDRNAWLLCMKQAILQQPYSPKFSKYLLEQLHVPADRILQAAQSSK